MSIDPFTDLSTMEIENDCNQNIVVTLCDLHHGVKPLQRLVEFCGTVQARGAIVPYNNRFVGLLNSIGLKCIGRPIDYGKMLSIASTSQRKEIVLDTARISKFHPCRIRAKSVIGNKEWYMHINGDFNTIWGNHLESKYSLNIPLNQDRNCRFWEILFSGSIQLAPRFPRLQLSDIPSALKGSLLEFEDIHEIEEMMAKGANDPIEVELTRRHSIKEAYQFFLATLSDNELIRSFGAKTLYHQPYTSSSMTKEVRNKLNVHEQILHEARESIYWLGDRKRGNFKSIPKATMGLDLEELFPPHGDVCDYYL
jgi:hypothetical protein